jgi:crossover junction endodeoxyribonuclease RuvC
MILRVGIDNGQTGAIVAIDDARRVVLAERMPLVKITKTRKALDCAELYRIMGRLAEHRDVFVCVEHAQAMPAQGASSGFNYGVSVGAVRMAVEALLLPHAIVTPSVWQRRIIGATTGGDKAKHVAAVRRLLPDLDLTPGKLRKPHDGLADAGLMALWAFEERPPLAVAAVDG